MKPTHISAKTSQPAIMMRPGHSVTGNMLVYAINDLLQSQGKAKKKGGITEDTVRDRVNELLQDAGPSQMERGGATHGPQDIAHAWALRLFPDFMPLGKSPDAISQAEALIFASQTGGSTEKPATGKKKKGAQEDAAE